MDDLKSAIYLNELLHYSFHFQEYQYTHMQHWFIIITIISYRSNLRPHQRQSMKVSLDAIANILNDVNHHRATLFVTRREDSKPQIIVEVGDFNASKGVMLQDDVI